MVWYGFDFSRLCAFFISPINFYAHTDYHRRYGRKRILVSKMFLFCYFFGNQEEDKGFMLMTSIRKRLLVVQYGWIEPWLKEGGDRFT
jgi:hypothetical protein